MAAKTPDSVKRISSGSVDTLLATFSTNNIDNGDTWATGLSNVVDAWAHVTSAPTVSGSNIAISISSGTLTFSTDKDNLTAKVYVTSGLQA